MAVVGGGPAGAVAALTLARAGRRVLVVDDRAPAAGVPSIGSASSRPTSSQPVPSRPAPAQEVHSQKVPSQPTAYKIGETLPPAARPLLHDLGLWPGFRDGAHLRCTGTYAAWGAEELHDHSHLFDPHGHGWHLDRAGFDAWLLDAAVAAGARLCRGSAVRYLDGAGADPRKLLIRREGTMTELRCSWVVDASGRRAVIGRHRAVRRKQDRLVAVSVLFAHRRADAQNTQGTQDAQSTQGIQSTRNVRDRELRTLVEAVPDGWWYTAQVPAGRLVAHLTDPDLAAAELRTPAGFLEHVARTRHVASRLSGYDLAGLPAPSWTPAHGLRLTPAAGPGWLAVGDAALAFDPLSSQGILTALHTGYRGACALDRLLRGRSGALAAYTAFLDGIANAYHRHHADSYGQERRWEDSTFWQRRQRPPDRG
ncbi:NAD(P)/FAD-dependent oxidoreductase [Streptomyces telluris]|uniref:FAD-dependent monooxygenase n=1 Tax=Streptomyces telluris TaxID=2720021 RepID=A0A9X2LNU0_9ACTN|nr:FAD-dependent monooxygenase [Streptomyces telluris]MCQ8774311.1 FAD-dependent monooxygenase [Streptomyces telluris]